MLEDLEGDTQQRDGSIVLWIHRGLLGLWIVTTSALLQILRILRLHKQEERNSHKQDFIQSQHGVLTLGRWNLGQQLSQASGVGRADMSSFMVISPERLTIWC